MQRMFAAMLALVVSLSIGNLLFASADEDDAGSENSPLQDAKSLLGDDQPSKASLADDHESVELGLRFKADSEGKLIGLRYFRGEGDHRSHAGTVWTQSGHAVASATFQARDRSGWQFAELDEAVKLRNGGSYVVSYHTSNGYVASHRYFTDAKEIDHAGLSTEESAGVFRYGREGSFPTESYKASNYWIDPVISSDASTPEEPSVPEPHEPSEPEAPAPAPEPEDQPAKTGFPGPGNTGVPAAVSVSKYSGPMTITQDGTVIDAKEISGTLVIAAKDVVIKRSVLKGNVDSDRGDSSVTISDSEVDGGSSSAPAIGYRNVTVLRSDVQGSQHSVLCGDNCHVEDSWLHDQALPAGSGFHNNAFISNGGSNVVLRGNTLHCTPRDNKSGGGCSTNASFFGDFSPISDVTIENNLFKATPGGYCGTFGYNSAKPYGTKPAGIIVRNNVFEPGSNGKCGVWGPVTGFDSSGSGNVFSGNEFTDGSPVGAAK